MTKYVVAILGVIAITLTVWAFWPESEQADVEPDPDPIVRTVKTYGDTPFESEKLQTEEEIVETFEITATDERIFLLEDGKWIEDKLLEVFYERYDEHQEYMEESDYFRENPEELKVRYDKAAYIYHIDAFKRDVLQDHPDKQEYIDTLYETERLVRDRAWKSEDLVTDEVKNQLEDLIEKARKLRAE